MILKRLNLLHLLQAEKDAVQLDYKPPDKKINNTTNLISQLVNNIPTQHLNETQSKMNQSVANNSVLCVSPGEKSVLVVGDEKKFSKKRKIDTSALLELDLNNTQHESTAKKFKNVLPNKSIMNTQQIASQTQKQADAAQLNFDEEDLELDL